MQSNLERERQTSDDNVRSRRALRRLEPGGRVRTFRILRIEVTEVDVDSWPKGITTRQTDHFDLVLAVRLSGNRRTRDGGVVIIAVDVVDRDCSRPKRVAQTQLIHAPIDRPGGRSQCRSGARQTTVGDVTEVLHAHVRPAEVETHVRNTETGIVSLRSRVEGLLDGSRVARTRRLVPRQITNGRANANTIECTGEVQITRPTIGVLDARVCKTVTIRLLRRVVDTELEAFDTGREVNNFVADAILIHPSGRMVVVRIHDGRDTNSTRRPVGNVLIAYHKTAGEGLKRSDGRLSGNVIRTAELDQAKLRLQEGPLPAGDAVRLSRSRAGGVGVGVQLPHSTGGSTDREILTERQDQAVVGGLINPLTSRCRGVILRRAGHELAGEATDRHREAARSREALRGLREAGGRSKRRQRER